ncbi:LytTR family DNA-binding domain-containing protein, partial [Oenococcus oeni]
IYEMKTVIPKSLFIQISNSEIVNISQIKNFSLSQTGIYQVNLLNGRKTYTSRRYTQIIRKELLK